MRRRHLFGLAASFAGVRAAGQVQPWTRAAVVIGVDRAGDLPILQAAASGAEKVGQWLRGEGFHPVVELVDRQQPVTVSQVFDAVRPIVERGTVRQLVIYFAGHGFVHGYVEHWLLSRAPDNPNEAVLLSQTVNLARQSGIPHIVIISDACRSRSDSMRIQSIHGGVIFPTAREAPPVPADVDQFLATLIGEPSWEAPLGDSTRVYDGLYTATFLDAYRRPTQDMIRRIGDINVIPNARLKGYLARELPLRAARLANNLKQRPDSQVSSGELSYIGRLLPNHEVRGTPPDQQPVLDLEALARVQLETLGIETQVTGSRPQFTAGDVAAASSTTGFAASVSSIAFNRELQGRLASDCGFTVRGARISRIIAPPNVKASFENVGTLSHEVLVRVDLGADARASSIGLQFIDGSGTVLAALRGFVGDVVVGPTGVTNVSYFPTKSNKAFADYTSQRQRVERLHSVVATSARFGVYRVEGTQEGKERAALNVDGGVRLLKQVDPTLALYAAYAYSDAGLTARINALRLDMRASLGVELFDVAMLSNWLIGKNPDASVVPFAPMLSQGWSLLGVKGVRLNEDLALLRQHLQNSLWLTLSKRGVEVAERVILGGKRR